MSADLLERPLILGARGQLGTDLMAVLADRDPIAPDRSEADLERLDSLAATVERRRPSIVINCAAATNVDGCEKDPNRAFAVNAIAVDALARICAEAGTAFATISTDFVFPGDARTPYRESDPAHPLNTYGISKLAGEFAASNHGARWFVLRTCGLYGVAGSSDKGYTFVERILSQARKGDPLRVVDDVVCTPSYTMHVAQALRRVVESGRYGLYHVTNAGACSWFEFAREALALAGVTADLRAVKQAEFVTPARRPRYTVLAHEALLRAGIEDLPPWQDGLRAYYATRSAAMRSAAVNAEATT